MGLDLGDCVSVFSDCVTVCLALCLCQPCYVLLYLYVHCQKYRRPRHSTADVPCCSSSNLLMVFLDTKVFDHHFSLPASSAANLSSCDDICQCVSPRYNQWRTGTGTF